MFLSTVVPSTMLNATKNLNTTPYGFTVPYNFVRGKNIIININPKIVANAGGGNSFEALWNTPQNRVYISIPDNVTSFSTNMRISTRFITGSGSVSYYPIYTVQVTCDTTANTIKFTPLSLEGVTTPTAIAFVDESVTTPCLITISTVL